MREFLRWQQAVRARFASGRALLRSPTGMQRFRALFVRNGLVLFLVFFDATLCVIVPALIVGWACDSLAVVSLCIRIVYGALLLLSIVGALLLSIFDLPNHDRERAYLDTLIPKLLPLPFADALYAKTIRRLA